MNDARGIRGRLRNLFGRRPDSTLREQIEEIIEQTDAESGVPIGLHEQTLLRNTLRLREVTAYDVMIPRADIFAIKVDTSFAELIALFQREAHSRVPVYRETLDDTFGMVHVKDVLRFWDNRAAFRIEDVIRKILFVAPSMRVLDLLLEMRRSRIHMVLVVDEYGGVDGLVTIEDLVEEIVGDIEDEYDVDEAPSLAAQADGSMLADARVPLSVFEERMGRVLTDQEREESDLDTLGGLLAARAARVPGRGEVIADPVHGFEFEVLEADPRRVKRLRVRRIPTAPAEDQASTA
jgi:CBS domain containing-hemolysin-like protein